MAKMSDKCRTAVRLAAKGGMVSQAKIDAIESALSGKMRELAGTEKDWQTLTRAQRMGKALEAAKEQIAHDNARKVWMAELQAARMADSNEQIQTYRTMNNLTQSAGVIRYMNDVEKGVHAIRNEYIGHLKELIDASESKDGAGLARRVGISIFEMDNPKMTADIVREIFKNADGSTGNKDAQAAAKKWLEVAEALRVRANNAGADIGKLDYGYLTQLHDALRIFGKGTDADRAKWVDFTVQLLDHKRYLNEDGSRMAEPQIKELLSAAWETITTGGRNKTEPGQFRGTGARANKGSESRVLHFKDGDAWMAYMGEFGEGSMYDAMTGHVGSMARTIGLIEKTGPNPEQWFRVQNDIAQAVDGAGTWASRDFGAQPESYWNIVSGKAGMPENRVMAAWGQNLSNVNTASLLGGAVVSSLTDMGTIMQTLHFNKLPYMEFLANVGKSMTADTRDFLTMHGILGEQYANAVNKWTGEQLTHSMTGRVAAAVMKLSFMNAWTDTLRRGFSMSMSAGLARMAKKGWGDLAEYDRRLLMNKGISEADWAVVQQATPTMHKGVEFLTADSVRGTNADGAEQIGTKILSFVIDEAQFAVVNPDLATRVAVTGGGMQRGTIEGEAMRSFAQFKSFPTAMLSRHWRRIFETPAGMEGAPAMFASESKWTNRMAGGAALVLTTTLLGALVLQIKALLQGKDPFDATQEKFWLRALAQGGGMGFLGDLLFKDPTENRGNTIEQTFGTVLGPTTGAVAGLAGDVVFKNLWEEAQGKESNAGSEALRWAYSRVPFQSLWYTRGVFDRMFLHNAQEALNPGYLSKMEARAQRDWGQGYWAPPGDWTFEQARSPDWQRAVGQ